MSHRVCPFWLGYLLLCPFRRFGQDPDKILASYVDSGMTVLEVGSGMGFFTLPLARLFAEITQDMKPGARCLVTEPSFHVSAQEFDQTIATAAQQGLQLTERPRIWGSRTAVLSPVRP